MQRLLVVKVYTFYIEEYAKIIIEEYSLFYGNHFCVIETLISLLLEKICQQI